MGKRKVVVTGAAGLMAGLLLPSLRDLYDLTLLDVRKTDRQGNLVEGVEMADLLNPDRNTYRHYFRNTNTVVHCAFVRSKKNASVGQQFSKELSNIQMTYNVYQTALEEKVSRVVVASSNHASDYYEPLILDERWDFVTPDMASLSDNYYGWTKIACEKLGFMFAVGKQNGKPLENIQIRIGAPRETDVSKCRLGDLQCLRRALAAYISQRDMIQLFVKSIEAKDIRNEQGVSFQIFYGISNNPHAFWSTVNARQVIGYNPKDNSEIKFADLIRKHICSAKA